MLHSLSQGIVYTLITVRISLHASTSVTTTQRPTTRMKFIGFPGTSTNTTEGLTTTIDQSTDADSLKHAGRIDNIPGSRDEVPLENLLGDEKVEMESDTPPGTV
jgi:hypothetical protein